jgi:hypothetical protein
MPAKGPLVEGWYPMNLWHKLFLSMGLSLLIFLVSCSNPPLASPAAGEDQNWVIITSKQAEEMGIGSWLAESDGFWTPSTDVIIQLEDGLADYLSQHDSFFYRQPPAWERLDEYQSQYIGLQRAGSQIIYGNFFCNNLGMEWQKDLVIVMDGGDCYFQIEYDVGEGAFIMLMVNGAS